MLRSCQGHEKRKTLWSNGSSGPFKTNAFKEGRWGQGCARVEMAQVLIPLGLQAVEEELQAAV